MRLRTRAVLPDSDVAILLGALTGVDPRDLVTGESRGKSRSDYTQFLDPDGMRGARIGVARNFFGFNEKVDRLMEEAIRVMQHLKAEEKGPLTDEVYINALKTNYRLAREEGIDAALREHQLDAIVAPSAGPPWLTDLVNGDHHSGGSSSPTVSTQRLVGH